jgi:hypothetical protein
MHPLALPESHKFACAVTHVWPVQGLDRPIYLSGNLLFSPGLPFELDEVSQGALGTSVMQRLQSADFCLLLHEHSSCPADSNEENQDLFRRVQSAFECTLLGGIPKICDLDVLAGAWRSGRADVRNHDPGLRYFYSRQTRPRSHDT